MNKYDKEFKLMLVGLLEAGQSARELGKEYDLCASTIRRWRREHQSDKESFPGKGNPSLSAEEKKLAALQKELAEIKLERDILKKALHIFSKGD